MVQIFNRNKSIMTSGTIKTTESIEVANNAKTNRNDHVMLNLQPLLAVLIPEVESTIRSSSCKCVMHLRQVIG
jgi:hypothetical protein